MLGWCIPALWLAAVIPVTVAVEGSVGVEGTVASSRSPQNKVGLLFVYFACHMPTREAWKGISTCR